MKWIVLILTSLLFNAIAIIMRKHIKISELYTTVVFSLFLVLLSDTFASLRLKLWGFFQVNVAEFSALIIILGIYPAAAAMIINWYPYQSTRWKKFCYLMGWTIFSTMYEWLTLSLDILWHIHWNLYYSFFLYPFIYYLLILHVKFYRRLQRKSLTYK